VLDCSHGDQEESKKKQMMKTRRFCSKCGLVYLVQGWENEENKNATTLAMMLRFQKKKPTRAVRESMKILQ